MHPSIDLFGLSIPSYGICAVLGIAAGLLLLTYTCRQRSIPRADALYFACYALIAAFIGAKLLYLIVELPHILEDPSFLLSALRGGLVFYGGVIGGIIGGWLYARHYKLPLLKLFDIAAPVLTIGQAFGRVGCFLAGCCYGAPCEGPLCVVYPEGGLAPAGVPLLATQLMEAAFLVLLTGTLLLLLKRIKKTGAVAGWYFVLYAVWRFIIEFFRSDARGSVGALSTSQFISIFLFAVGIFLLVRKPRAEAPAGAVCPEETLAGLSEKSTELLEADAGEKADAAGKSDNPDGAGLHAEHSSDDIRED